VLRVETLAPSRAVRSGQAGPATPVDASTRDDGTGPDVAEPPPTASRPTGAVVRLTLLWRAASAPAQETGAPVEEDGPGDAPTAEGLAAKGGDGKRRIGRSIRHIR